MSAVQVWEGKLDLSLVDEPFVDSLLRKAGSADVETQSSADVEKDSEVIANREKQQRRSKLTVIQYTQLMKRAIKNGDIVKAQQIFDLMKRIKEDPTVVSYNTLMNGYKRAGNAARVFDLFDEMLRAGIQPDEIVYTTAISACAIDADAPRALELFSQMTKLYGLEQSVKHTLHFSMFVPGW